MTQFWEQFLILATAHLFAVASPGPDFLIVSKHTVNFGRKAGAYTALGVGVAILLHVTYAILGFSLLVQSTPKLYTAIKIIGALYLIYLGVSSIQSTSQIEIDIETKQSTLSPIHAFWKGFLTNALNIKAMLFFLFLFTSLINETTTLQAKIIYGAWLSIFTFVWFAFIAYIFGQPNVRSFFQSAGVWFDRITGILFILLALFVLFTV